MRCLSRLAGLCIALCAGACADAGSDPPVVGGGGTGGITEAAPDGNNEPAAAGNGTTAGGSVQLVTAEGWVGGEPSDTADNPLEIQGAFYTYGDGLQCCQDSSCEGTNPCVSGACCWSGNTVVDSEYLAWGCGLGLELNSTGGDNPVKSAYAGAANCFAISLSGDSGGNKVRVGVTQLADTTDKVSPFVEIPSVSGTWSDTVCFDDVACPSWSSEEQCQVTGEEYDLQIQVVGGERESSFELCVESIVAS
jgi:hypothetical protein